MTIEEKLEKAAQAITAADALLIAAGAGMGVDSGLPDFRGTQGFWRAYPVIAKRGYSFEEMANPTWFENDPNLAWAFYGHRLILYRRTVPHAGFTQLLDLARQKRAGFFVFTSNVDGHFQKAGFPEDRIVECHGSIHYFQCTHRCSKEIWEAVDEVVHVDETAFRALEPLPACRVCRHLARPNVLMFNDYGWVPARTVGQEIRFEQWLKEISTQKANLAVIELGAGTAVPTVRLVCERRARAFGGTLIRVNLREAAVPPGQIGLPLGAAEGIAGIVTHLR